MKIEPLTGDYCPLCVQMLRDVKLRPGEILPMCHADLNQLIQTKDLDILRRLVAQKVGPTEALMQQVIEEKHDVDENGNPAGGETRSLGISITWQNGPLGRGADRKPPNGAFVEGVISAALGRLEFYQAGKFKCRENALAITKLQEALMWLDYRTRDREKREVEGTYAE